MVTQRLVEALLDRDDRRGDQPAASGSGDVHPGGWVVDVLTEEPRARSRPGRSHVVRRRVVTAGAPGRRPGDVGPTRRHLFDRGVRSRYGVPSSVRLARDDWYVNGGMVRLALGPTAEVG